LFIALFIISFLIKPLIIFIGTVLSKYDEKTAFFVGTGVGQISEFSLVLVQYATISGIFSDSLSSNLIIFIALSMILTPYILMYNHKIEKLFSFTSKPLANMLRKLFKIKVENVSNIENIEDNLRDHIIIFGAGRMGSGVIEGLKKTDIFKQNRIIVVDDDPDPILKAIDLGLYAICGQADNDEILNKLNLNKAKLIILTIPFYDVNSKILRQIDTSKVDVFCRAYYVQEAYELYRKGVKYVVVPQVMATNQLLKEIFGFLEKEETTRSSLDSFYINSLKDCAKDERIFQRHHRYKELG